MASISFQAPEAKARLEAAHAALRQQEEELTRLRELVKERESEFMAAIVKDGAVATTATAAAVALNPATATKVQTLPKNPGAESSAT
jgi:Tfp pilus assembly protein PilX